MSDELDFLDDIQTFESPVPEFRLKQESHKLVFSTRAYPEWIAACYGILRKKYEDLSVDSASRLIQLILQDYINDNFNMLGDKLPPTEKSINFLIRGGFINPEAKSQFTRISKANQKAMEKEAEINEGASLKKQYEYYKNRDPEKAEKILNDMTQQALADMEEDEDDEPDWEKKKEQAKDEEIATGNRSGDIASLDHLDDVKTAEGDDDE